MEDVKISPADVWKAFYDKVGLTSAHIAELREKRGFSDDTIEKLGFRSSQQSNRAIIESLLATFPGHVLGKMGLAKSKDGKWYPAPQYCGYGRTNRKDENGEHIWDYVDPILIPYFDEKGGITAIRPHKGNPPRPDGIDEADESWQALHVYCPLLLRITENPPFKDVVVLTEGEFKAAALMQAGIPALAFPGIHSARNYRFRRDLVSILQRFGIKQVIIVFDNETKDDPDLPAKYKPDPWDRYDALVYAKYTAQVLEREGFPSRIGILPEEWKIDGKADWDGALAKFVKAAGGDTKKGTSAARKEFTQLLRSAESIRVTLDLFPTEAQRIVHAKLSRLNHDPLCPIGSSELNSIANQIAAKAKGVRVKMNQNSTVVVDPKEMATAIKSCIGRYLTRTPVTKDPDGRMNILEAREEARQSGDWATVKFCDQLALGWPKPISNFILSCDFKLVSAAGNIEYLVRISNIHKERSERHVRLNCSATSALREFRKFCNENSCTWAGGEKDLQNLTQDLQAHSAFREIVEVPSYGYDADSKLWKFADRAFPPSGKPILPDRNMVFWHEGIGYQTDFNARKLGDGFTPQGAPVLGELDERKAVESFLLLSKHLYDAIGGYDGWLALGAILAYAVHPRLAREKQGAPGLSMTGPKSSGKSTIIRWLIRIWGFNADNGPTLVAQTTGNFVARYLSKFPCLPAWLDEYDETVTNEGAKEMLKAAYDRHSIGKATYDGTNRTKGIQLQTTPVVSGETGMRNPATRSRYIQITVQESRAIGNPRARLKIMNNAANDFRHLGHFLMLHREAFETRFFYYLNQWESNEHVSKQIGNQRDAWTAGVPVAAWVTACEMLHKVAADKEPFKALDLEKGQFEVFGIQHGAESHKETYDTSYVNQFWTDIISMLSTGAMPKRFFEVQYCKIDDENRLVESRDRLGALPMPDYKPVLFFAYNPVYMIYEMEVRKTGRVAKLSRNDLRREFKREPYWILPKKGVTAHQLRFSGSDSGRETCWAFQLDVHPFGEHFTDILTKDAYADA